MSVILWNETSEKKTFKLKATIPIKNEENPALSFMMALYYYFEEVPLLQHLAYGMKLDLFCKYFDVIIFVLQNKFICMKYLRNTLYII